MNAGSGLTGGGSGGDVTLSLAGDLRSANRRIPFAADVILVDVGGLQIIGTCGGDVALLAFRNRSEARARIFDQAKNEAATVDRGATTTLAPVGDGQSADTVLQVAWGPVLEKTTSFIASFARGSGCPAEAWVTAVTGG